VRNHRYSQGPSLEHALTRAARLEDLLSIEDFEDAAVAPSLFDERLVDYSQQLVAGWMQRFESAQPGDRGGHGLNAVAVATVEALSAGLTMDDAVRRIVGAARNVEERSSARAALLGIGRMDLLAVVRGFSGEPTTIELEPIRVPVSPRINLEAEAGPTLGINVVKLDQRFVQLYRWSPSELPSLATVPEEVRAVFSVYDMPVVQDYLSRDAIFDYGHGELDVVMLLHSAGEQELLFNSSRFSDPTSLVEAGAQIAVYQWQRAVDHQPVDVDRVTQAREFLGVCVAAGATVDFELALDDAQDCPGAFATAARALEVVATKGTAAHRAAAFSQIREVLAGLRFAPDAGAARDEAGALQATVNGLELAYRGRQDLPPELGNGLGRD
jgi:hypothetical protein